MYKCFSILEATSKNIVSNAVGALCFRRDLLQTGRRRQGHSRPPNSVFTYMVSRASRIKRTPGKDFLIKGMMAQAQCLSLQNALICKEKKCPKPSLGPNLLAFNSQPPLWKKKNKNKNKKLVFLIKRCRKNFFNGTN